jgi:DNA-directed RNA polymerase specialized sigma24 family protein
MSEYINEMSDLSLLMAISKGQRTALKELMDRYLDITSLTAYRILCDHADSMEVTKKVFINLWKTVLRYDYSMSVEQWLLMKVIGLSRRKLIWNNLSAFLNADQKLFVQSVPKVDDADDYVTTQAWEIFCRASFGLAPLQRVVYTLSELDSLSEHAVKVITGLSRNSLHFLFESAKKRVEEELGRFGKVAEYIPYVSFLKKVRDNQVDNEKLETEILYLCTKM